MLSKLLIFFILLFSIDLSAQLNSADRATETNRLFLTDRVSGFSVEQKASGSMAGDYVLTMPVDDGLSNECLKTDGSGVLSWGDCNFGGGVSIGDTISGSTAQSVLYVDGSNQLANSNLMYDDSGTYDFSNPIANGTTIISLGTDDVGDRIARINFHATNAGPEAVLQRLAGTNDEFRLEQTGTSPIVMQFNSNKKHHFTSNGEVLMNSTGSNNLLGGTGSGSAKFVLDATTSNSPNQNGIQVLIDNASGNYGAGMAMADSAQNGTYFNFYRSTSLGPTASITYNQSLTRVETNMTNTVSSDYRLKTNVNEITDGLDTVLQLKPKTFQYLDRTYTEAGFIAHEFAEVIPNAVSGIKDAVDGSGNPQYQSIAIHYILPYLVSAFQQFYSDMSKIFQFDVMRADPEALATYSRMQFADYMLAKFVTRVKLRGASDAQLMAFRSSMSDMVDDANFGDLEGIKSKVQVFVADGTLVTEADKTEFVNLIDAYLAQ